MYVAAAAAARRCRAYGKGPLAQRQVWLYLVCLGPSPLGRL